MKDLPRLYDSVDDDRFDEDSPGFAETLPDHRAADAEVGSRIRAFFAEVADELEETGEFLAARAS